MTLMTATSAVLGAVMAPIIAETGWPRTVLAAQVFIMSLFNLVLAPVAGKIVARFGVRRYAIASILAAMPGLLLITQAGDSPWTWYAVWIVFGIINVGIGPLIWSTAVATLFDKSRGLALAIVLSGGGIAFLIFPPFAVAVESHFGWRGVYVAIALLFLVIQLPLTLLWFKSSPDLASITPAASGGGQARGAEAPPALPGYSLSEALRSRQFWQMGVVCMLVAVVEGAMMIHLFPILNEGGLDKASAAAVASLMGLAMIVGRVGTGALLDRFPGIIVFAASIGIILLSVLFAMGFHGGEASGAIISLLLGFGAGGTTNAFAYLTSRYFGLAAYASIFGLMMGLFGIAYGVAPIMAGQVRDQLGAYHPLFTAFAAVLVAAILLILTLGRAPQAKLREAVA